MIQIGVIGFGYWGPNLVRNFLQTEGCTVVLIADQRQERLDLVANLYPSISTSASVTDILDNNDLDAVVIATPVFTHFELADDKVQRVIELLNDYKHA